MARLTAHRRHLVTCCNVAALSAIQVSVDARSTVVYAVSVAPSNYEVQWEFKIDNLVRGVTVAPLVGPGQCS